MNKNENEGIEEFEKHPAISKIIVKLLEENQNQKQYIKVITLLALTTLIFALGIVIILISLLLK